MLNRVIASGKNVVVDQKKVLSIMLVYVGLITVTWWTWLKSELPQWFAYIIYLLITVLCLYFEAL